MDWDSRPAIIFEKDVANLPSYEPRKTQVAHILETGKLKTQELDPADGEKEIKDWLKRVSETRAAGNASGVYIIFAGHDEHVHQKTNAENEKLAGLHPNLQLDLPFSDETFEKICKTFYVNTSIIRTISRPAATFSRTHFEHEEAPGTPLISYNLQTHSSDPSSDLAMSVTTLPTKKLTYVILYGCHVADISSYLSRLRQCGSAFQHPMLLPGIFTELQRIKHKDSVTANIARLREYVLNLGMDTLPKGHRGVDAAGDVVELWERVSSDKVVLETWKGMLSRMEDAVEELETEFYGEEKDRDGKVVVRDKVCKREGRRIKERLSEIVAIYDELMRKCGSMIEGTTLANSTVWSRLAQRDSKQMKSIALLTMVFLPATYVATFFAMPIFEWRPKEGDNVVSNYIWIYVVVAVVLTVMVVLSWLAFSRNPRRRIGDEEALEVDLYEKTTTVPANTTAQTGRNSSAKSLVKIS